MLLLLPRSLRTRTSFPPAPSSSSFHGPALILPRDENPRCPPTDTNGYLCQRRNLLLYIPLYKQRVNRARALALLRVRAASPHREHRLSGYAPRRGNRFIDRSACTSSPSQGWYRDGKLEYTGHGSPRPEILTVPNNDSDCSLLHAFYSTSFLSFTRERRAISIPVR